MCPNVRRIDPACADCNYVIVCKSCAPILGPAQYCRPNDRVIGIAYPQLEKEPNSKHEQESVLDNER